jgi:hypothetical protein
VSKKRTAPSDSTPDQPRSIRNEDGTYNQEEFIIPAQDDKGHSTPTSVRLSAELSRDIEIIIQGRVFPYKTQGDLLRHAVVRHLEWLHVLEPGFPTHLLSAHLAQMDVLKEEEMRLSAHLVFKKLHDQVDGYMSVNELGEARRVAATVLSRLTGTADSAFKRRFESRFRKQYKSLLDGDANPVVDPPEEEV